MDALIKRAIKIKEIVYLVNYKGNLQKYQDSKEIGYITKKEVEEKEFEDYTLEKINKALKIVKLNKDIKDINNLTKVELMKLHLAKVILMGSDVLVFDNFFKYLIFGEQQYFMWLVRNLVNKQNKSVVIIDDDMNFICEYSKKVYLVIEKRIQEITDFYDEELYKYVNVPRTVELIKYLESKGHKIDHEITFNETLKAIYRGGI